MLRQRRGGDVDAAYERGARVAEREVERGELQRVLEREAPAADEVAARLQAEMLRQVETRGIAHGVDEAQRLRCLRLPKELRHDLERQIEVAASRGEIHRGVGWQLA